MTHSYLNKIGENEFRIDFKTEIMHRKSKSIEIDGEVYTKEWVEMEKFDSVINFNNSEKSNDYINPDWLHVEERGGWEKYAIKDFEPINGQIYYVWNYSELITNPATNLYFRYENSTDWYVNILKALVYGGHVKSIIKIYNDKTNNYISKKELRNDIIKNRATDLTIYSYGFQNCIKVRVNFYSLLKLDFTKIWGTWIYNQIAQISEDIPDLIPQKLLRNKLQQVDINSIAINILNKSINYKQ